MAVPGLVPDLVFFEHLANRRFPVTRWIREEHEFAYIVEPDVFHDFFGHVPMLFDPVFADYMEAYGRGGLKAEGLGALPWLARLYWYTVEFGLIRTPGGLRSYGAGILSSPARVDHSVTSPAPRRVAVRPRARHAQPLPHRRLPGDLLRRSTPSSSCSTRPGPTSRRSTASSQASRTCPRTRRCRGDRLVPPGG